MTNNNNTIIISDKHKNLSSVFPPIINVTIIPYSFSIPGSIRVNNYANFSEKIYRNNSSTNSIFVTCTETGENVTDRSLRIPLGGSYNPYNPPSSWNIYVYSDSKEIPSTLVSQGFCYYTDYSNLNKCTVSFFVLPLNYYMIKSTLMYKYDGTTRGNGIIYSSVNIMEFNVQLNYV